MEAPTKTLRRLHDNTDSLLKAVIDQINLDHRQIADANHPYQREIDRYFSEVRFQIMRVRQELDYKATQEATKIFDKSQKAKKR